VSQVLEREVSEGYPVDGAPFEIPQKSRDNEAPRFVTVLGSTVEPETAIERAHTKWGGIEVSNPCLNVVKNFIRKGRLTPVLVDKYAWMNVEMWQKSTGSDASYFDRPIPAGYQAPMNEFGRPSLIPPMKAKLAYPGDQIHSIINGSANIFKRTRRGVVELKSLAGMTYNPIRLENGVVTDPELWRIQTAIFPKYPTLPILLDEIEELLEDAKVHTSLRATVDEMLQSLTQFRDYATGTVEQTEYTMREIGGKSEAGYIPRYTGLDFVLIEQLGRKRQDREIRKETADQPDLKAAMAQLIALQIEEKQANIERIKGLEGSSVSKDTMAAAPIEQVSNMTLDGTVTYTNQTAEGQAAINEAMADVETPSERFECVCGNLAKSLAGKKAHERFCEIAKAQKETASNTEN
jgi:spermidine/putrescine-binding protein